MVVDHLALTRTNAGFSVSKIRGQAPPDPAQQHIAIDAQLIGHPITRPGHRQPHVRSARRTSTKRIDRSRSSTGYLFGAGITPPFHGINPSTGPGTVHPRWLLLGIGAVAAPRPTRPESTNGPI